MNKSLAVSKEKQETVTLQKEQQLPKWKRILSETITRAEVLARYLKVEKEEIEAVTKIYPMKINKYYLGLIKEKNDAIWKQCVPNKEELYESGCIEDPLHEEEQSPVQGLVHRYPDRVLLLVGNDCAMYCRFCTRKRKIGKAFIAMKKAQITEALDYLKSHTEIRDVLLSGGDPLLLEDEELDWILAELRAIKHIEIIRIGTRIPCSLPMRITKQLCEMLRKHHPLFINTHFNHPDELSDEAKKACGMLADAGIPLGNQSVLLKGVNDNPETIMKLNHELLKARVKPYYLYQADMVKGTNHFRTRIETGINIMEALQGHTSGLAVPHYIIDSPGGGGKIPVSPEYVLEKTDSKIILRNFQNRCFEYQQPE